MRHILTILVLFHFSAQGQMNPGPRSAAMGSAMVSGSGAWAMQHNPAGITDLSGPVISMAYEQHFLDRELSTRSLIFVLPYRDGAFGLGAESYGFSAYKEQSLGFAYARKFGPSLHVAIGLRVHQLSIPAYGSSAALTAEAGFQYHVSERLRFGSHIYNPGRSRYDAASASDIPIKISFGCSYEFSDKVLIVSEIRKMLAYPTDIALGLEYGLVKAFTLRGGISANPFKQHGGFGLSYSKVSLDAAISHHPSLGYSPQIGLSYEF